MGTFFVLAAVMTELVVVALLIYRRVWKSLPVFFAYCIWALLSDITAYSIKFISPDGYGIHFYVTETALDFCMQFAVLVELAWSVLKPLRANLSRRALWIVAAAILVAGAAIWPFASIPGISAPSKLWLLEIQLQQTVSILRIGFFLLLAACSHLLSMGWRDRELQVATGFGFYSFVSLVVATVTTHQSTALQFQKLSMVVAGSFLCSLLYWVFSFSQKEKERREFTPRMQHVLLVAARAARVTRGAIGDFLMPEIESPEAC